mgnify:CR=1 FL=1
MQKKLFAFFPVLLTVILAPFPSGLLLSPLRAAPSQTPPSLAAVREQIARLSATLTLRLTDELDPTYRTIYPMIKERLGIKDTAHGLRLYVFSPLKPEDAPGRQVVSTDSFDALLATWREEKSEDDGTVRDVMLIYCEEGTTDAWALQRPVAVPKESLADGADRTNENLEKQRGFVSESSSAVEEMSANISSVSANARDAYQQTMRLIERAEQGNQDMTRLMEGIQSIAATSETVTVSPSAR